MPRSAREHVDSLLKNAQDNSDARSVTEDNRPRGLYDLPPDHPNSLEHPRGSRKARSTERNVYYRGTRDRDEQKRLRSNDTRARNASRVRVEEPPRQASPSGDEQGQSNQPNTDETRPTTPRGRSQAIRCIPPSPSLGSTNGDQDEPTQTPAESQFTYRFETLDHQGLVKCAQEDFGIDVRGCDTQTIIDRIRIATAEQASQVGPTRRSASIVLQPSAPFRVGGGWSQDVLRSSQPTGSLGKRSSDAADLSEGSSKRQRKEVVVDDDTATESETDDDVNSQRRLEQQNLLPSHEAMSTTAVGAQPSIASSHSLGGSLPRSRSPSADQPSPRYQPYSTAKPKLPRLLAPVSGPVHARLRKTLIDRALRDAIPDGSQTQPLAGDLDEVPETEFGSPTEPLQPPTQRPSSNSQTYRGQRSHVQSDPDATASRRTDAVDLTHEPSQPNSPNLTPSQLIQMERVRAVAAKVQEEMADMPPRRRPLVAIASQPPASRSQPRPSPQGGRAAVQRLGGTSRRMDAVSVAREDMLAFNQAVAQKEATSFVESVTRQSERSARCAPPESRRADELLEDDEETLAQAEAYAQRKWPSRSARVRKPKPLARDVSGIERQVLVMAKIHLFAYALVEGVYQTRATFLRWAAIIHQATWEMELPDHPYRKPADEIFEIMVNSIATMRGKVKERLREFVARVAGFQHTTKNQKIIERNLVRFNRLYPNSYHCKTIKPRSGDYESTEVGHCLALAIFHGPNSVGVMYPDYFREMPLTVVAFALAIWQFCIEEWANGWRENGDLGMSAMRDKYEAQLAGLKRMREVAPRRTHRLQDEWRDYVAEYSGAAFQPDDDVNPLARELQIRPDTPEPAAISIEEMDARLLETARQESLRSRMMELAAEELAEPIEDDEDDADAPHISTSRSPSPIPIEYNEDGVLTARSKGKGRAK